MKYFVFGDVHGYYSLLIEELKKKGYDENNDDHLLISLGDNFDRGPENYKMYEFLKRLQENKKIILVKGNHEELFLNMLYSRKPSYIDITNGTYGTVDEFSINYFGPSGKDMFYNDPTTTYLKLRNEGILDFMYDMLDYYETPSYIFVHGFIPINEEEYIYKQDWRNSSSKEFSRSRWLNGIEMSRKYKIGEAKKK